MTTVVDAEAKKQAGQMFNELVAKEKELGPSKIRFVGGQKTIDEAKTFLASARDGKDIDPDKARQISGDVRKIAGGMFVPPADAMALNEAANKMDALGNKIKAQGKTHTIPLDDMMNDLTPAARLKKDITALKTRVANMTDDQIDGMSSSEKESLYKSIKSAERGGSPKMHTMESIIADMGPSLKSYRTQFKQELEQEKARGTDKKQQAETAFAELEKETAKAGLASDAKKGLEEFQEKLKNGTATNADVEKAKKDAAAIDEQLAAQQAELDKAKEANKKLREGLEKTSKENEGKDKDAPLQKGQADFLTTLVTAVIAFLTGNNEMLAGLFQGNQQGPRTAPAPTQTAPQQPVAAAPQQPNAEQPVAQEQKPVENKAPVPAVTEKPGVTVEPGKSIERETLEDRYVQEFEKTFKHNPNVQSDNPNAEKDKAQIREQLVKAIPGMNDQQLKDGIKDAQEYVVKSELKARDIAQKERETGLAMTDERKDILVQMEKETRRLGKAEGSSPETIDELVKNTEKLSKDRTTAELKEDLRVTVVAAEKAAQDAIAKSEDGLRKSLVKEIIGNERDGNMNAASAASLDDMVNQRVAEIKTSLAEKNKDPLALASAMSLEALKRDPDMQQLVKDGKDLAQKGLDTVTGKAKGAFMAMKERFNDAKEYAMGEVKDGKDAVAQATKDASKLDVGRVSRAGLGFREQEMLQEVARETQQKEGKEKGDDRTVVKNDIPIVELKDAMNRFGTMEVGKDLASGLSKNPSLLGAVAALGSALHKAGTSTDGIVYNDKTREQAQQVASSGPQENLNEGRA